jgi:hypothetical protein
VKGGVKMKIDWNKQVKEFLQLHNWKFEDGYGYHPLYPLMEDFSTVKLMMDFCKEFYGLAWETYEKMINGLASLKD